MEYSKVIRDKKHRNYESLKVYKKKYFPAYCSGRGYLIKIDAIPCLLHASQKLQWLNNEDANTGVLMEECHIKPHHHKGYLYEAIWNQNVFNALQNLHTFKKSLIIHGMNHGDHLIIQSALYQN